MSSTLNRLSELAAEQVAGAHPDSTPVRIAVVGLGYWGPNLVRNLHELPSADVVAVCDLEEDALGAVQRRYPAIATTTSIDDVLRDESIEAVAIATPVS